MALTRTQIISASLLQLGHAPVSSLDGGDDLVVAAEMAYDLKLPSVLSSGNWRFASQIQELSLVAVDPPYPYISVYELPAGFLKTIQMYPNIYTWDIFKNEKIYATYEGRLWMQYIFQPDVSHLPAHFVDYFTYEISSYLALSNAQKADFYQVLEAKRIQMQAMAHAIETQNRPQFTQVNFPVLDNRYISTLVGNSINM